jgi:hypothetical protein
MAVLGICYNFMRNAKEDTGLVLSLSIIVTCVVMGFSAFCINYYNISPQVSRIKGDSNIYITEVDKYTSWGGIKFDCNNKEIYLSNAIIENIPRLEKNPKFTYCNLQE